MPKLCCDICNKQYTRKSSLDNHKILCDFKIKTKREHQIDDEELDDTPTHYQLVKIVQKLTLDMIKMEEKMEQMQKWVNKTKKKINVLEWLNNNSNLKLEIIFDDLADNITIIDSDIELLFNSDFYDVLNEIFIRNIYNKDENEIPLFSFIQKTNTIYVYTRDKTTSELDWIELSKEKLIYFLNKVHFKIVKSLSEWNKKNIDKINSSDKMAEIFTKAKIKLMGIDFKHEQTFSKVKQSIYNKTKKDIKALIEYDFEF
jgi:hypothetical protein